MRCAVVTALLAITAIASIATAGADDAARARFHWIMNCQGCHQADATGSAGGAPNMSGVMAKFLAVEGGRDYLGRVPGVAFAPLPDAELAELLNWSLRTFDAAHLPSDFPPYTAEEVGRLRATPLVSDAAERRRQLIAQFESN
ncbi:MAG: c-type cytochrome [Panacagrimonas sp.]